MKDRIIEMLGNGIPQTVVAKAVGCDDSYITQLMSEDGVRSQIAELRLKDVEAGIKVDDLIEDIEQTALERLRALLPMVTRPMEAARIFQTVNSAKKRNQELIGNVTPTAPLVQINISQQAAVAFKLSSDQQVVEVDGRSMTTMPAKQLVQELTKRKESRPAISDATTAEELLTRIEQGIPQMSIAHVL